MKGAATLLLVGLGVRLIRQSANAEVARRPRKRRPIKPSRPLIGVILLYLSNPTLYAFWIAVAGTATAHHMVDGNGLDPGRFRRLLRPRAR